MKVGASLDLDPEAGETTGTAVVTDVAPGPALEVLGIAAGDTLALTPVAASVGTVAQTLEAGAATAVGLPQSWRSAPTALTREAALPRVKSEQPAPPKVGLNKRSSEV